VRARTDLSLVAALLLTACAKPTEVELRLKPCGEPVKVDLDIQGYDGEGAAMTPLSASFEISDEGVFGDGYATVGLKKPEGMVTADFTLTWHGSDDARGGRDADRRGGPGRRRGAHARGGGLHAGRRQHDRRADEHRDDEHEHEHSEHGHEHRVDEHRGRHDDDDRGDTTTTTGDDTTTTGTTEVTTESTEGSSTGDTILGDPCNVEDEDLLYCEDGGAGSGRERVRVRPG
jgi:hypothetical protein